MGGWANQLIYNLYNIQGPGVRNVAANRGGFSSRPLSAVIHIPMAIFYLYHGFPILSRTISSPQILSIRTT